MEQVQWWDLPFLYVCICITEREREKRGGGGKTESSAQCGWEQHRVDFYKVGSWELGDGGGGGGGVYPHLSCGIQFSLSQKMQEVAIYFSFFFFPFRIIPCRLQYSYHD